MQEIFHNTAKILSDRFVLQSNQNSNKNKSLITGLVYKYEAKSVKGVIFMISTLFSIIIMGLSITGYIDLNLTQHQFRDIIEKEVNGELTCIGSNKSNEKNPQNDEISRKSRHVVFDSPKIILEWNCSHAAEVLSTCYASIENGKREDIGKNQKVQR